MDNGSNTRLGYGLTHFAGAFWRVCVEAEVVVEGLWAVVRGVLVLVPLPRLKIDGCWVYKS